MTIEKDPAEIAGSTWKAGEPMTAEALRRLSYEGPWQLTNERLAAAAAIESAPTQAPRHPDSRRIRVEWREPGKATVRNIAIETRGDDKVRLVIVRAGRFSTRQVLQACESAGLYPGATVLTLPSGAEFEVWEEP